MHVNCPVNTITDRSGQGGRSASLQAHLGLAAGEAIVSGVAGAPLNLIGASVNLAARVTAAAIRIARETGMAYFGSITLAVLARTERDPQASEKILAETEALLSTVAVSHNHWLGRRQLIELGWELRDPQMVEFQASALETDGKRESGPYLDATIRRGRILARTLRHDQSTDWADEIAHLKAVAGNCGSALLKLGLDECEATLSG